MTADPYDTVSEDPEPAPAATGAGHRQDPPAPKFDFGEAVKSFTTQDALARIVARAPVDLDDEQDCIFDGLRFKPRPIYVRAFGESERRWGAFDTVYIHAPGKDLDTWKKKVQNDIRPLALDDFDLHPYPVRPGAEPVQHWMWYGYGVAADRRPPETATLTLRLVIEGRAALIWRENIDYRSTGMAVDLTCSELSPHSVDEHFAQAFADVSALEGRDHILFVGRLPEDKDSPSNTELQCMLVSRSNDPGCERRTRAFFEPIDMDGVPVEIPFGRHASLFVELRPYSAAPVSETQRHPQFWLAGLKLPAGSHSLTLTGGGRLRVAEFERPAWALAIKPVSGRRKVHILSDNDCRIDAGFSTSRHDIDEYCASGQVKRLYGSLGRSVLIAPSESDLVIVFDSKGPVRRRLALGTESSQALQSAGALLRRAGLQAGADLKPADESLSQRLRAIGGHDLEGAQHFWVSGSAILAKGEA